MQVHSWNTKLDPKAGFKLIF